MDGIALKRYEEKLLKRKAEILGVLKHLHERSEAVTGISHMDWLDRAWEQSEAELVDRLTDCYRRELEGMERAIARIRSGTYGYCMACHQPIEKGRLESLLDTQFCLECGEVREAFERI